MKKRKTQKPKPVKAWALVGSNGRIVRRVLYNTRSLAFLNATLGERIVRVTITVEDWDNDSRRTRRDSDRIPAA